MATKPGSAYIDNLPDSATGGGYYDLDSTRDEYLAFHYPGEDPLAELLGAGATPLEERYPFGVRSLWEPRPAERALDVGAAVGRVTFDLARDHEEAIGIDFSATLIDAAREVQRRGRARYRTIVEGNITREWNVPVETETNATFAVADALALPFADGEFGTVVGLNLIDRVPDPLRALDEMVRVTASGGRLVVGSPYTWLDTFTPPERWLGGFERAGSVVRGRETVRERCSRLFVCIQELRLPFFISHHARSGQLGVAHIQVFSKSR